MLSHEIRDKFLKFFEKKGHVIVPSSSLMPKEDSSILFTTAGMQQFKPYYLGKPSPYGQNVASIQKCVRTSDIEEVGDASHLTFFEMLGNFSFGGYWKKEAIEYAHEFVMKVMGLTIDYVTVFAGEDGVSGDNESAEIWKSVDPNIKVKKFGRADNFWGPTGEEGPCGPTTEIYVNGIEIWNIVFNEYYQDKAKKLTKLESLGVDTGMGLERLTMAVQKVPTVFDTDLFTDLLKLDFLKNLSEKKKRILADHSRAIAFMISDGVRPSNKDAGYILRRLLRRLLTQFDLEFIKLGAKDWVANKYGSIYPELDGAKIWNVIEEEGRQFIVALNMGVKELEKLDSMTPEIAFYLYSTYGLPFDVIKDKFPELSQAEFDRQFREHQELSRAGMEQKFKGGLAGHSEMEVKYHTATHLLHQALHDVLGEGVEQRGSNITPERLRFDFSFLRKLTDEEKNKIEEIVNGKIKAALPVQHSVLNTEEAIRTGARHFFDQRYPEEVSVYYIGNSLNTAYSKEFCGGPHVENTGALGKFKITKEEAVSAGVRRIKAVLE